MAQSRELNVRRTALEAPIYNLIYGFSHMLLITLFSFFAPVLFYAAADAAAMPLPPLPLRFRYAADIFHFSPAIVFRYVRQLIRCHARAFSMLHEILCHYAPLLAADAFSLSATC